MSTRSLTLSLVTLFTLLLGGWYIYDQTRVSHTPVSLVQSGSTLVSDLANPFGSGGRDIKEIIYDTKPTQPTWETSSGKEIYFNTNWMGRTMDVQGKSVYYQFGVGNPRETDKSVEELIEINKRCYDTYTPDLCDEKKRSLQGEFIGLSKNEDGTFEEPKTKPTRMTPEIEYLVYSFLSNPLLREAGTMCGQHFWRNEGTAQTIYLQDDIGFIYYENWWNPYNIDINRMITINPDTGRKELNTELIWSLYTQISTPSKLEGGNNYTNTNLTNCLTKNNILIPLQAHVDRHYRELMWLWREYKVEY
jgi:hypothetical protein